MSERGPDLHDLPVVICHYRVKPGCEQEFRLLLDRHWPTLRELELVTDSKPLLYMGGERDTDGVLIVEVFEWVSGEAARRAPEHPQVSEIWEGMEKLCEARSGRPSMEFPHFRRLDRP